MRCIALAAALLTAPLACLHASADTTTVAAMPVIDASVSGDTLRLRLPDGIVGDTRATAYRTITVEGFDANGRSLGEVSASVHKRLTYASVTLSPALIAAQSFAVSAR